MGNQDMSRRSLLEGGGAAFAGLTTLEVAGPVYASGGAPDEVLVPWLDEQPQDPPDLRQIKWERLDSWLTPNDEFFTVCHYGIPDLDERTWRLGITGLVARPESLRLIDLKGRHRREQTVTLECSGNHGFPALTGAVGNARWAGTPLAPLLERAGLRDEAREVVFYGADAGTATIRDNAGIVRAGTTGRATADESMPERFALEDVPEQFSRSMSLEEALDPDNLLCWEMNGEALPPVHGYPLRLIAPSWYGVASVKWLTRIEVIGQRHAGRFMARDFVTIREEKRDGEPQWTFSNVGRMRLKSAPAKVMRRSDRYTIMGVAWGTPIADVEVRIDDGPWLLARLDKQFRHGREGFTWTFWTLPWNQPAAGEHRVTSRAFDYAGNVQPPPEDPYLASRVTYWENNGQITRRVRIP